MKKWIVLACLGTAFAASASAFAGTQQEKMKDCNRQATSKELIGEERKAFMKTCLSAESGKKNTQQQKMKACNTEASSKSLKGDERKAFMSTCLKG